MGFNQKSLELLAEQSLKSKFSGIKTSYYRSQGK